MQQDGVGIAAFEDVPAVTRPPEVEEAERTLRENFARFSEDSSSSGGANNLERRMMLWSENQLQQEMIRISSMMNYVGPEEREELEKKNMTILELLKSYTPQNTDPNQPRDPKNYFYHPKFRLRMLNAPVPPPDGSCILATHTVKIRPSGIMSDVVAMWELGGTQAVTQSAHTYFEEERRDRYQTRLKSMDSFDKKNVAFLMIHGLRFFYGTDCRGKPKQSCRWAGIMTKSLIKCITGVLEQSQEIFEAEPRLLRVESPAYVLGDIHGNYHDLMCFERLFWRSGPQLTPASFIFLGDYVDRGAYGVEVVCYLLSMKIMAPERFFLLRGNHELRGIQEQFSFKEECYIKFQDEGEMMWQKFNDVFDRMPLAAVIDDKIFCVHGGIPAPPQGMGDVALLSDIEDIQCPLEDPETESQVAWEILWNDPIKPEWASVPETQRDIEENFGFAYNFQRRTGHMWSFAALERFLTRNNLSHVIRAHEVKQVGFQVLQQGKLLTVFSSSFYCKGTNEAACVIAHKFKLRMVRIETAPNAN